jgi:hypothetical protein
MHMCHLQDILVKLAKANSEASTGKFKGPHPVPGGGRIIQVRPEGPVERLVVVWLAWTSGKRYLLWANRGRASAQAREAT